MAWFTLKGWTMDYIKVEVFVTDKDKWRVLDALNEKGFLKDDGYDSVFAESKVIGHFTPLEGSDPDIGNISDHTTVDEVKLEFRIKAEDKDEVYKTIKASHPYEVPVINFFRLI